MTSFRMLLSLLVVHLGLSACGGEDSAGGLRFNPDPVPMSTRDDLLREWPEIRRLFDRFVSEGLGGAATDDCGNGSVSVEEGTAQRTLKYFNYSGAMFYYASRANRCGYPEFRINGYAEFGFTTGAEGTAGDPAYTYNARGEGGNVWSVVNANEKDWVRGREEVREAGDVEEGAQIWILGSNKSGGGSWKRMWGLDGVPARYSITTTRTPSGPFSETVVKSYAFNGVYSYVTDSCQGGEFWYSTEEPVVFDDFGPVEGRVVVRSGDDSVTVTFEDDGTASYQFSHGGVGALSKAEMNRNGQCYN